MLLAQRVRNGLICYFEIVSSYEEQRAYERNVPIANVPAEVICMWEDSVDGDHLDWFTEPAFSPSERAAIREFHAVWKGVIEDTPQSLLALSELIGTEPWERLRLAAEAALGVFNVRGKLFDEPEILPD
ncbi:MAG: hypothetical protein K1X67_04550 [Fimbriimonadaceae bacterium]|nr:hypothetical protein [Fimbriimonadaceae bacterium]